MGIIFPQRFCDRRDIAHLGASKKSDFWGAVKIAARSADVHAILIHSHWEPLTSVFQHLLLLLSCLCCCLHFYNLHISRVSHSSPFKLWSLGSSTTSSKKGLEVQVSLGSCIATLSRYGAWDLRDCSRSDFLEEGLGSASISSLF